MQLEPNECRVLGVLIEKALTTPSQYPITLNALTSGCNQKSNRLPVLSLSEDDVLEALDGLRKNQLAREVMMSGSRVAKYRHHAREALGAETPELVVLAELLLRGPQTLGELRGRASRMHPLESLEVVESVLRGLMQREPAMARQVPPASGSRAARFIQLLCPDLHRLDLPAAAGDADEAKPAAGPSRGDRIDRLEREVAQLRGAVTKLAAALGENVSLDPERSGSEASPPSP